MQLVLNPDQAAYSPNQVVQVDVNLAQAPGGSDQLLRMVEFDLQATNPFLTLALPLTHNKGTPGTGDDIKFWSFSSLSMCVSFPSFCGFRHLIDDDRPAGPVDMRVDVLSIAYFGLTADSTAQILLPASGVPLTIGRLQVTMPAFDGDFMLNLVNAGDPDPVRGTHVDFGFDSHIIWEARLAAPNDVTGGTVLFHVFSPLATSPPLIALEPDIPKTRVLSFNVPPAGGGNGSATAIKITMVDLQNPNPPNLPQYPPPNFGAYESETCMAAGEMNGCARWVGKPGIFLESQDSPGLGSFAGARLQCTPYYHDFAGEGLLHVTGAEIVPSSTYKVEVFGSNCNGNESTCMDVSAPVTIGTRRSGDVSALYQVPSPATLSQPNAVDVAQLVNKFKNVTGALVKAIAQLQPNLPELNADVSALDIVAVVDALKGFAYPLSGPCPCPSTVPCGSVACPSGPAPCVAAFGAGAMCVKTCTGGANHGDPCISDTHCPGGTCGNAFCRDRCGRCDAPNCDDQNPCTDDSYLYGVCEHADNTNSCNDNNACTTNDHCSNGSCSGTILDCNDSNECTDDSCNPASGCVLVNNSNSCTDGLFCNGSDTCSGGNCGLHSGNPCPSNTTCDEATQTCMPRGSVISFKAVKRNNVAITPTNNLTVLGGDTIEVELFLSNWINDFPVDDIPNNVRLFQVKLDRERYVSPDNGTAKPLGWCGPVERINCTGSATCPPEYPICLTPAGCTCSPHNPDLGGFITTSRTDFLLFGLDGPTPQCVTSVIDYTYYGVAADSSVPDTGVPRYLGTLILKVSANACGTFTIGFVQEIGNTFIADPAPKPNVALPALQPLLLTVSDCSQQLLSCSPGHCNIDARIAHDRHDQNIKKNTNRMVMTFSKPTTGMTAADFEITVVPYDPINDIIPTISILTPNGTDPKITTLTLNRRIQQTRWTCIREKGSNKRCCMGSLPADAHNNLISQPDDVFEVINNLQGCLNPPSCSDPLLPIERCDADRNLQCLPADLLMVVDLLNGADAFTEVNGDTLPALFNRACPSMNLAP